MTTDAQKKFVDELREYLKHDPSTAQWLSPLEPLLTPAYTHRFKIKDNMSKYLSYDDKSWNTAEEFYNRSKDKVKDMIYMRFIEVLEENCSPTGE